jgi:FkbM family methyltransferase
MSNERVEINMSSFMSLSKQYFVDKEIKNVMEIGSLNGNDSLLFKNHYPDANVFCIEGLPDNFNQYLKDLTNITPINAVIADYDGTIQYHYKNINGIHGILDRGQEYGSKVLELQCYTIKTICENYNIDSIDLVKIDVEGATYEILDSMGDMIKTIKIMHIETESYPFFKNQKQHDVVSDYLTKKGFTMVDMTSAMIDNGYQHDSVWVNNNFLK